MDERSPNTVLLLAVMAASHGILHGLVVKGLLTQSEAAEVLVKAANTVREGTEDSTEAALGEGAAQTFERFAGFLLGYKRSP
ncbi:MAG: hypothetical protein V7704_20615 [Aurantimonas endophytica]|uniref:hypothetical protein n=1 Tax=Aurantimonas endophytica TaxID=1522175 RepID=UPI0030033A4D